MAGYNEYSMSNNAVAAYDQGLVPASKIKGVPARAVRCARAQGLVRYEEWHHSSKHFNRVEFYDPRIVRAAFGKATQQELALLHDEFGGHEEKDCICQPKPGCLAILKNLQELKEEFTQKTAYKNCRVEWLEWSGSRNHPKCTERRAEGCLVTEVTDQTVEVQLPDGTKFRKRRSTNGFSFAEA